MATGFREIDFEEHIVRHLTQEIELGFSEYIEKDNSVYNKDWCVIPEDIVGFIKDTQKEKYDKLVLQYGVNTDAKIVERVVDSIKKTQNKTIQVLREKIKDRGQNIDLVYFKPTHNKTPEHQEWYKKNRLTVIRQLKYSKQNENSIDIVLFLNGLPVISIELKNALTGQYLHR